MLALKKAQFKAYSAENLALEFFSSIFDKNT
jgi:hypothetical protein